MGDERGCGWRYPREPSDSYVPPARDCTDRLPYTGNIGEEKALERSSGRERIHADTGNVGARKVSWRRGCPGRSIGASMLQPVVSQRIVFFGAKEMPAPRSNPAMIRRQVQ